MQSKMHYCGYVTVRYTKTNRQNKSSSAREVIIIITQKFIMKLRVGLFGGGIVGGGVVELVNRCLKSGRLSDIGASIEIVKICVRSKDKPRDFEFNPLTTSLVTNYEDILDDSSINCVVELMGGGSPDTR
jgi:homoserine dehydrogenase